jgi:hypothetical protein
MAQIPGTPKMEFRNCPEIVPVGVPGLWELITPDCKIGSRRGLNQTCSTRWDLSNDVLHFQFGLRKEVDSRLLVVGSQIVSLTPGRSFAHNLGDRCSNAQCEVFWVLLSSSKHSGVPEDSKSPTFPSVGLHPHTWPKWGCDTFIELF